jgi:hypothetical protein
MSILKGKEPYDGSNIYIIQCSCGSDMIQLSTMDTELCIAYYAHGHYRHGIGFWNKMRYIWRIITTGYPYGDDICINEDDIDEVIEVFKTLKEEIQINQLDNMTSEQIDKSLQDI